MSEAYPSPLVLASYECLKQYWQRQASLQGLVEMHLIRARFTNPAVRKGLCQEKHKDAKTKVKATETFATLAFLQKARDCIDPIRLATYDDEPVDNAFNKFCVETRFWECKLDACAAYAKEIQDIIDLLMVYGNEPQFVEDYMPQLDHHIRFIAGVLCERVMRQ